jgi:hypothetical protein
MGRRDPSPDFRSVAQIVCHAKIVTGGGNLDVCPAFLSFMGKRMVDLGRNGEEFNAVWREDLCFGVPSKIKHRKGEPTTPKRKELACRNDQSRLTLVILRIPLLFWRDPRSASRTPPIYCSALEGSLPRSNIERENLQLPK